MVARRRRDSNKSAPLDFLERTLGRTGLGFVVGPGRPSFVGLFFVARSADIFASPTGVVHPVRCSARRDVALYRGWGRLTSLQWHQATINSIEVRFRGLRGDQAQQGYVILRKRNAPGGARSGVRAGGGAVALMVELLSGYPTLPRPLVVESVG